jgi:DNA-directed RNA polymerase specialized sigma24 family protein
MRSQQAINEDAELARQCAAGEEAAWQALYHTYHRRLLATIARQFGPRRRDTAQVEEVAGEVWFSLLRNNFQRLRAYDPRRASLAAYLVARARQQAHLFLRRQVRQLQQLDSRTASDPPGHIHPLRTQGPWWEDFWRSLTNQEQQFVRECLSAVTRDDPPLAALTASQRKLKQRVVAKLRAALDAA